MSTLRRPKADLRIEADTKNGLTTRSPRAIVLLFLYLLLAPAGLCLLGQTLFTRKPDLLGVWGPYLEIFCIPALAAWARFGVGIFAANWLKALPRGASAVLALLYGEASYFGFLIAILGELLPLRGPLLVLTVTLMAMAVRRLSYSVALLTTVTFLCLFIDGAADFYWRIHFLDLAVTPLNLAAYLGLSFWSLCIAVATLLLIMRNQLYCRSRIRALRDAVGLTLLFVIYFSAHLYANVALFTDGETFYYTDKAISLQWKRNIARRFPALPQRVYANLIKDYQEGNHMIMQSTYYPPGIPLYVTDSDAGIGSAWADFYESSLKKNGFTQYRIEKFNPPAGTTEETLYHLFLYSQNSPQDQEMEDGWKIWPGIELYSARHPSPTAQYVLYLPKSISYSSSIDLDPIRHEPEFSMRHTRTSAPDFVPTIYDNYLLGIDSISMYLQRSHNFLDDSVQAVHTACAHEYLDSFIDYLYFSVATLSTTGYGDITAIDPEVRIMTMVEIALGWLLLSLFGSFLLSSLPTSNVATE